jgi:hypothetical protein
MKKKTIANSLVFVFALFLSTAVFGQKDRFRNR